MRKDLMNKEEHELINNIIKKLNKDELINEQEMSEMARYSDEHEINYKTFNTIYHDCYLLDDDGQWWKTCYSLDSNEHYYIEYINNPVKVKRCIREVVKRQVYWTCD